MSRIVYPKNFSAQRTLFIHIKQKHDADGAASILLTLLSENNIDMNDDEAAGLSADSYQELFENDSRHCESLRELRDNAFKPAWKRMTRSVQFLKSLYMQNTRTLGDWSITVNNKNRIAYPRSFSARAELFTAFVAKHNSYAPGTSPLQIFLNENSIDLAADLAAVNQAKLRHEEFEKASGKKEMNRELRDNTWKPVATHMHIIGSYVKTVFDTNPHRAGDYGFTVDSTPRAHSLRTSKVKCGKSIRLKGVVLGSKLTNKGKDVIHIFKNRKALVNPVILSSNNTFEIVKGYSTIIVFNPSQNENAVFSTNYYI